MNIFPSQVLPTINFGLKDFIKTVRLLLATVNINGLVGVLYIYSNFHFV